MLREIKKILTIAGSDSCGGAGIQADLKTITVLGGYGMSVLTALTAQNTTGVQDIMYVPVEFIEKQIDSVVSDIGVNALKTGMLPSSEVICTVAKKIIEHNLTNIVVDPVMLAKCGTSLMEMNAKEALIKELIPLATVITPNIPEAEELSGIRISCFDDMKNAAQIIFSFGTKHVVIKGGHLPGDALDIMYDGKDFYAQRARRINTKDTHGTGCTYSAAIAVGLADGMSVLQAVKQAKQYITHAIRRSLPLGQGHGPMDHMAPLKKI